VTGSRHGGTISSFISWVASGSAHVVSLLPRASSSESPWFAFFVLELEQELIEERTGLWREVLRELAATSGKANVDQALKVRLVVSYFLPSLHWTSDCDLSSCFAYET
jgi:hypothetical protein